ncbi:hypothetical protein LCGC14_1400780 [marine sediment metagenome]|uniref:Uncharacterized protein n=1 Tax=marine sediment metagenome TaxID=412755 RepID=A0A0F9JX68_9ZZZZ
MYREKFLPIKDYENLYKISSLLGTAEQKKRTFGQS